ncbi:DNA polymerase [Psychrobacillus psychrodurans]|uniref:DNA polymerase n=1 Tax=Psychrobacillus psychrodurans TaxID=126157 RepID=UPI001F4DD2C7|nr:DNA polymerase [Psychrobacillus psychrodurans]MCK1996824.1 DNA polymerase [Psychrobacillus psychrodurans]
MKEISIDIETFSATDLLKSGVYRYVEDPDFEILLFAYSIDGEPVEIVDFASGFDEMPEDVFNALTDPTVLKTAYNANFERTAIAKHFNLTLDPKQWRCTAVDASTVGLPGYLDGVAKALKLDVQKDSTGKNLIKYFSLPCKATKVNEGRTRNYPHHDLEKWQQFVDYCVRDVEVEMAIRKRIEPLLDIGSQNDQFEQKLWALDQRIVDRGVLIDRELATNAVKVYQEYAETLLNRAKELTGLSNPNSTAQLGKWLASQDFKLPNLQKDTIVEALKDKTNMSDEIYEVLRIRQELSMSSVKKYMAMLAAICGDDRVRGILQFYGAGRTGRWAGRIIQPQNLPRAFLPDYDVAREALRTGDTDWFEMLYDNVPYALAAMIRTMIIPPPGKVLAVSDFSAIEARVIAWLAGEKWRIEVFKTHGKIYEASASQMFGIPIDQVDKELRQRGKVAELALGYQGGAGALIQMGALEKGLTEEELPGIVSAWRKASPRIKQLWYDCENAAIEAIDSKTLVKLHTGVSFYYSHSSLFIKLPSGRKLVYANARLEKHKTYDKMSIVYEGMNDTKQWTKLHTYGGKLVENIVQAIARDCLAESMIRLDEAGYTETVMHVHDEVVIEAEADSIADIENIMGQPIDWAPGLPLEADGFETIYYKKE